MPEVSSKERRALDGLNFMALVFEQNVLLAAFLHKFEARKYAKDLSDSFHSLRYEVHTYELGGKWTVEDVYENGEHVG